MTAAMAPDEPPAGYEAKLAPLRSRALIPPHNIDAEESLLGAMMLSRSAIADSRVVESDFYKPAHGAIFEAIAFLYEHGEPIDPVSVSNVLRENGTLERLGGRRALLRLQGNTPASANARHYSKIVVELAARRNLIKAAGDIAEMGYDEEVATADALLRSHELISSADIPLGGVASPNIEEFLSVHHEYEWVLPDLLEKGDRLLLVAPEKYGKVSRLDEPVATPSGWTTIGDLRPGDEIFGRDGQPCSVVALGPIMLVPDVVALHLSGGVVIESHRDHEWVTVDEHARQGSHEPQVRETREIESSLRGRGGSGAVANHAIPVAKPLNLPPVELPIPPYTLGVWLGDGTTASGSLTLGRRDADAIEAQLDAERIAHHRVPSGEHPGSVSVRMPGMSARLRDAGFLGHKHIPNRYLRASIEQRWALLRGLMDTDGYIDTSNPHTSTCELTLCCKTLVDGALELIRSLGMRVALAESDSTIGGRIIGRRWRMTFQAPENPFTVPFKAERWQAPRTMRSRYHYVHDVRDCAPAAMRCIQVDSPDGTYLVGEAMVPTHNSTLNRQIAVCGSQGIDPFRFHPIPRVNVVLFDFENPASLTRRKMRPLVQNCANTLEVPFEADRLRIEARPEGIDLTDRVDEMWLYERMAANREIWARAGWDKSPTLVIIGPIYKMLDDEDDRKQVANLQHCLDRLRSRFACALIMETHAPQESFAAKAPPRSLRPYGARRWLRWPEFCRAIEPAPDAAPGVADFYDVQGARDERPWPWRLQRGAGRWPWSAYEASSWTNPEPPETF